MAEGEVKIIVGADDSEAQEKLQDTKESFDSLGDKQKETQKETDKTTSKFDELAQTIEKQTKELSGLKAEYTQAIVNFGKGSTEAKELEGKISSLNSELHKNKETYGNAANEAKKLSSALDENEKSFGAADVAIGTFIADGLSSLVSKAGEALGSIVALADETREYREDMAKLDAAYTTQGHSVETAQKAYDGFYKILGESDRTVEAVNHLAEFTKNEEELAQWSTICAGVTAKFGDSLPIEGLTEAANETAKVGKVTGPLADALNWAGISEDEFNKKLAACNSEQERASLITSTLNTEYAAAAEEYDKLTANTQAARDATNNMEQAQAELGAAIEPVTTAWTNMKAGALQWFVDVGLPALQTGWGWIKDNLPAIGVVVGGLTAAWLAFGGAQTILNAVQTAGIAIQTALNAVMNANPIGLVILAITALVAGFMILWNNCEGFRNFWIGLWEIIKDAAKAVADWFQKAWTATLDWFKDAVAKIKDFFANAWEGIKNAFSAVGSFFSGIWNTIKGVFSAVGSWFGTIFSNAWNAIKNAFSTVGQFFGTVWNNIKNAFTSKMSDMLNIGKNIIEGIKKGISNAWQNLKSWFSGLFDDLIGIAKKILGIKSPSRVFRDEIGVMIARGLEVGIEKEANKPAKAIGNVFDLMREKATEGQKNLVETVKEYNADLEEEYNNHAWERQNIEEETNQKLADLADKYAEDKKKKGANLVKLETEYLKDVAEINKQYDLAIEKENERHATARDKIAGDRQKTIKDRMQEIVSLGDQYKENVKKIWEDLDKSITDLQSNYDNQLASRTESIANSLNLWGEASKNKTSAWELSKNLQSQVSVLEDYNEAIAKLEERNIDSSFMEYIKSMGVGSAGEIEALSKMSEKDLNAYVDLWGKKNELAREAAVEELEPLKAETEAKIGELTTAALDRYATLRGEFMEQGSLLMEELKTAMIEAGEGGYEEVIAQIDEYTAAGEDLMDGIVAGIADKSPAVAEAVTQAVNEAVTAAKKAAGIHSPSKVMADEVGANLGLGTIEGWKNKVSAIKKTMASDMSQLTANLRATVMAENSRFATIPGAADTGFADLARAVGVQTAGINSLAGEYRRGSNTMRPIIIELNGRELGHAFVDTGGTETVRIGSKISLGGAKG